MVSLRSGVSIEDIYRLNLSSIVNVLTAHDRRKDPGGYQQVREWINKLK